MSFLKVDFAENNQTGLLKTVEPPFAKQIGVRIPIKKLSEESSFIRAWRDSNPRPFGS